MNAQTTQAQGPAQEATGVNVITISRQYGAGASELARMLSNSLGFRVVDDELLQMAAQRSGMDLEKIERVYEQRPSFQDLRVYKERSESTPRRSTRYSTAWRERATSSSWAEEPISPCSATATCSICAWWPTSRCASGELSSERA